MLRKIAGKVQGVLKKKDCKKCGKEIPLMDDYCKFCGKKQAVKTGSKK